jgi:methionine aminopeptidase
MKRFFDVVMFKKQKFFIGGFEMKKEINVEGATVPVYTYEEDGKTVYEFDTSMLGPPEPMVNALAVLKLLNSKNTKVVMINHKKPMGLLEKVEDKYNIEIHDYDGKHKIIFTLK